MIAMTSSTHRVVIARDLATAAYADAGKHVGKSYKVWDHRFSALVVADSGDEACRMFFAAIRAELPNYKSGSIGFQAT